jgi:hypothetical protein
MITRAPHRRSEAGLSALELILAVAVGAIIMMALARLIPSVVNFFHRSPDRISVQTQAQTSMDTMMNFLNGALSGSVQITSDPGQPLWSTLSFKKLSPNGNNVVKNYQFVQSNDLLLMRVDSKESTMATNVLQVSFLLPKGVSDPNLIVISLTILPPGDPIEKAIFLKRSIRLL